VRTLLRCADSRSLVSGICRPVGFAFRARHRSGVGAQPEHSWQARPGPFSRPSHGLIVFLSISRRRSLLLGRLTIVAPVPAGLVRLFASGPSQLSAQACCPFWPANEPWRGLSRFAPLLCLDCGARDPQVPALSLRFGPICREPCFCRTLCPYAIALSVPAIFSLSILTVHQSCSGDRVGHKTGSVSRLPFPGPLRWPSRISVVCPPDGRLFPPNITQAPRSRKASAGGTLVAKVVSRRRESAESVIVRGMALGRSFVINAEIAGTHGNEGLSRGLANAGSVFRPSLRLTCSSALNLVASGGYRPRWLSRARFRRLALTHIPPGLALVPSLGAPRRTPWPMSLHWKLVPLRAWASGGGP